MTLKDLLGSRIKAPPADEWQTTAGDLTAFPAATIHSVKGREFPAVVVVFPANLLKDNVGHHAVDHWSGESAAEVRRVLYVGASRAEQLLILAVHNTHLEQVASLLQRDAVPHEIHREEPGEPGPSGLGSVAAQFR